MNVADLVKATAMKKEFDFFSKIAYICENFGKNINKNEEGGDVHLYKLPDTPGYRNYMFYYAKDNWAIVLEDGACFRYSLEKRDYPERTFNPKLPERWEKMIEDILKEHE